MISSLKSKSDFFNRRALFISANKVTVYHWIKGELGSSYLFDIDATGRENFERYLAETDNTPMTILLDVIEEEFRQDTIPHVFGSDRQALIDRKKSRLFRDVDYVYVQNQGREEEGRRDDRLLFLALTNQEIVKPWIALLEKYKVPLKGMLSIPLLLQSYIKSLPDVSDHALVVTMQSISGLRQTFFQNKELKISRLSKLPRYGTESYAPKIESEVEKIQRYLNSLRLVPNDKTLDVYIFADKNTIDELEQRNLSIPMLKRHYLDINKLIESSQENITETIPFSDQLLLCHLLKTKVNNCYASSHEMRYSKMRNIKYSLNVASIALLLIGLAYSGLNFMGGLTYKQESEAAKNKTQFYQVRYDLAKERLPKTPVEPAQIKIAVDAAATLNEYKSTPYEMLSYIGKGLEQYPKIKLDNFDWITSVDPNRGVVAENDNSGFNSIDTSNDFTDVKYYQISNLNARIEPFTGNYREAIAMVNDFAETLRSFDSTYSVSIESFPLDISSDATLQGNNENISGQALFTVRTVIGIN